MFVVLKELFYVCFCTCYLQDNTMICIRKSEVRFLKVLQAQAFPSLSQLTLTKL